MVESEYVVLPEDDPRSRSEHDGAVHLAAVDEADGGLHRHQLHDPLRVLKDAVLAQDVRADQLDVLRNVGFGGPDPRHALLDVVQQALGQSGVLVQVHQVRGLHKQDN